MGFADSLKKICDAKGESIEDGIRAIAFELDASVVKMSPVDSGRFRGNWMVGLDGIDTTTNDSVDKSGDSSLSRAKSVLEQWKPGQTIYISNSLPYAMKLEYGMYGNPAGSANGPKTSGGYSTQAPGGMVRLTVQRFNEIVKKEAAKIK